MNISHRRVDAGRLTLHVAEVGEGPAVLFLHGFPAYWADWQEQMLALAAAGFRVIAPDLPGYAESDKLPGTLDYRSTLLASDLAGLLRALGLSISHVVGHDWGGTLAYCLASEHPELVDRLVILNAGHPELFRLALRHLEQIRMSWYMFLFQLPWLPEWLVQRRSVLALALRGMLVRKSAMSDPELDRYVAAMRTPGAAHSAVSYYRAAFRAPVRARRTVVQRTLVLWGERDTALSARLLLTNLSAYVPSVRVERFAEAGHWLHRDLPEIVSEYLIRFFSAP
ncbi:MAG TPA: alpha/beta hydrolase [Polyangiaceae bacterium]|jgi:pimeloyl-ACP methyl ester carboxylesterase|nr:alpha/beta hydrolase [Polyangiaceae bacterium]